MDETDRPDDRRADGSWVLPNSESRRQRNHEAAQSGIQKRKKTRTYPRLSCKIEYLLASNHSGRSIASEFFTGDSKANSSPGLDGAFLRLVSDENGVGLRCGLRVRLGRVSQNHDAR